MLVASMLGFAVESRLANVALSAHRFRSRLQRSSKEALGKGARPGHLGTAFWLRFCSWAAAQVTRNQAVLACDCVPSRRTTMPTMTQASQRSRTCKVGFGQSSEFQCFRPCFSLCSVNHPPPISFELGPGARGLYCGLVSVIMFPRGMI